MEDLHRYHNMYIVAAGGLQQLRAPAVQPPVAPEEAAVLPYAIVEYGYWKR